MAHQRIILKISNSTRSSSLGLLLFVKKTLFDISSSDLMPSNILFLILLFGISRAYFPLLRVILSNTAKQYLDREEIFQQDNRLD